MAAENGHLDVVQWLLANRTEGFTADAIIKAKTDEIVAALVKSLSGERRDSIIDALATSGNKDAIRRVFSLVK
ncbi:hypothetical protein BC831DRAFT_466419 [Entophlyctis helioformis]|nr:hypothetical protein BC831DRAFT_466419 [Entophlyctis helioformis]